MPLNVPTFFKRLGSSVVFVAIMLTGLLWNEWSFLGLVCLIGVLCLREYLRLLPKINGNQERSAVQVLLALPYIVLPMCLLFLMYKTGKYLPLMLLCMIWSNDTMAYLVGSFFGKTPFSSISPKKTWEGTAGGAIITIIAAGIVGYFVHYYRVIDWIALALCATVMGTIGDLLESKLKRMADVKDTGAMMPGHGGALDRFDSLLVATPFAFLYVFCCMH
jgi:phosphatidate cytidylyltransferase